jgi:hypothetical protein
MTNEPQNLISLIDSLRLRIEQLEKSDEAQKNRATKKRRLTLAFAAVGCLLSAGAGWTMSSSGLNLTQYMEFSDAPVNSPPLGTGVRWGRFDTPNAGVGGTTQILSMIAEGQETNSFLWPLYIQLSGTNQPNATALTSQSVGAYVRAVQRSSGSPWLAGYHSEIAHGMTSWEGQPTATNGTSILYNGEMTTTTDAGTTIGINIQNTSHSTHPADDAIRIQPGPMDWQNGIHFGSGGLGNIGINFDSASYLMGLDLANNSLRMNADQKIIMDQSGSVFLRFNSSTQRVEVVRNYNQVVASW